MNKANRNEFINRITDSITIIKGNAELALAVERPKWVDRYLSEIVKEVETTASLIMDLDKQCQSQCYSSSISSSPYKKSIHFNF